MTDDIRYETIRAMQEMERLSPIEWINTVDRKPSEKDAIFIDGLCHVITQTRHSDWVSTTQYTAIDDVIANQNFYSEWTPAPKLNTL